MYHPIALLQEVIQNYLIEIPQLDRELIEPILWQIESDFNFKLLEENYEKRYFNVSEGENIAKL